MNSAAAAAPRALPPRGPGSPAQLPFTISQPHHRLGGRLTRAAVMAAGVALLVVGVSLNVLMYFWTSDRMAEDARVQVRIMADNSVAPMMFGDVRAATETLASLRASPTVLRAALADSQGRVFAEYRRNYRDAATASSRVLHTSEPVTHAGRLLGQLTLTTSRELLHERVLQFAGITLLSAVAALSLAYLLALGVRRDIDRTEQRLDEMAFLDPVTGLHNRNAANRHLAAVMERARRRRGEFGVMMLDLDDFKVINDTLGHAAGDEVLATMAARLRERLRQSDLLFRLCGDEFIVVFEGPLGPGASQRLGQAAMAAFEAPVMAGGQEVYVRGSAGLAQFPADAAEVEKLVQLADAAMYSAKASGKNTFAVYEAAMGQTFGHRLRIENDLRRAMERGELMLHYQPIVRLSDGCVTGVEALLRWHHPEHGVLTPGDFIAVAESSGLIVELGAWVLREAARQVAAWQGTALGRLHVAVNVSARQIKRSVLPEQVAAACREHRIEPGRLEVEITEYTLIEDAESNMAALDVVRKMGLSISVDDFGTGHSSLSYLKRLPIDRFKIDRSFVRELPGSTSDAAIVQAVVQMAHALGLGVVAEGVETEEQRALLQQLGCDHAQGYLFSRPVSAERLAALLGATGQGAAKGGMPLNALPAQGRLEWVHGAERSSRSCTSHSGSGP